MKRLLSVLMIFIAVSVQVQATERGPNILLFLVDDWGRYARLYADPLVPSVNDIVQTPNIDRIGREGVVFNNAFVGVSSCSPSRASLVTGRYFWNCGSHAFLNGGASNWKGHANPLPSMTKFPDLLRTHGYFARKMGKTIDFVPSQEIIADTRVPYAEYQRYGIYVSRAKDKTDREKRVEEVLNHPRFEMRRVLKAKPADKPFFFVYGTINVHRPYQTDSGSTLWGIDPNALKDRIPKFLPDVHDVRRDFADYLGEVQAADAMLGAMLGELETANELDNTLIILTGDNGIPGVPRGKTNCYDLSVRAPLLLRWPEKIQAGRRVDDFVSLMDIGPTLLDLASIPVPREMDGQSFYKQLVSPASGWIDPQRDWVVLGRELHYHSARDGFLPYPMRAIRTKDHLFIRNFKPDRWPNGAPYNIDDLTAAADYDRLEIGPYRDLDASLTKSWMLAHRNDPDIHPNVELTLGKRTAEELYDVREDPDSLRNLSHEIAFDATKKSLSDRLMSVLLSTHDPRLNDTFDGPPYVDPAVVEQGGNRKKAKQSKKELN
jgi:N-sulfoglucosamine sulfohydrolase